METPTDVNALPLEMRNVTVNIRRMPKLLQIADICEKGITYGDNRKKELLSLDKKAGLFLLYHI